MTKRLPVGVVHGYTIMWMDMLKIFGIAWAIMTVFCIIGFVMMNVKQYRDDVYRNHGRK